MDLTLLLTAIAIIVAIIIGVWQIYLAQKQIDIDGKSKKNQSSTSQKSAIQKKQMGTDPDSAPDKTNVILWVDDDIEIMHPFIISLKKEGFTVRIATNLYKAKEILTSGEKFDLVITDLMIPYGIDEFDKDGSAGYLGLEIVKLARKLLIDVPILILTVAANLKVHQEVEKLGKSEVLIKPILPSALTEKVKLILFKPRPPDKNEVEAEIERRQIELTSDSAYIRRRAIWALGELCVGDYLRELGLNEYKTMVIDSLEEIKKTDSDISVREAAEQAILKIKFGIRRLD